MERDLEGIDGILHSDGNAVGRGLIDDVEQSLISVEHQIVRILLHHIEYFVRQQQIPGQCLIGFRSLVDGDHDITGAGTGLIHQCDLAARILGKIEFGRSGIRIKGDGMHDIIRVHPAAAVIIEEQIEFPHLVRRKDVMRNLGAVGGVRIGFLFLLTPEIESVLAEGDLHVIEVRFRVKQILQTLQNVLLVRVLQSVLEDIGVLVRGDMP